MTAMRRIAILAFPGVQTLDVHGPAEVFATASAIAGGGAYATEVVATQAGPLPSSSVTLHADRSLDDCRERLDTLLVAGGAGVVAAERHEELIAWIAAAAGRARRVASVCTGAFLLARAGLLEGRRATTHWSACAQLASRYPGVEVDPDPIFVRHGPVITSAGVTAGMDLALALVEEDLGRELALEVARWLVLFVKRPGGQAQFSAALAAQAARREPLRELQDWIPGHLEADLSVPALARRACMSERNFARAFRHETGLTPAAYVEAHARRARPHGARVRRASGRAGGPPGGLRHGGDDAPGLSPPRRGEPRRLSPAIQEVSRMKVAIPIYPDFTALDAVGPYDVLARVPGVEVTFVAAERGPVRTETDSLALVADRALAELTDPDIVVVPGGFGNRELLDGGEVVEWLREVHAGTTLDHLGVHRCAAAGRRRDPRRPRGHHALGRARAAARVRRGARPAANRHPGQGDHGGRRVGRDRHGAPPRRGARRARRGPGDPARNRVRPPAAVRRRVARQGARRTSSSCCEAWR